MTGHEVSSLGLRRLNGCGVLSPAWLSATALMQQQQKAQSKLKDANAIGSHTTFYCAYFYL